MNKKKQLILHGISLFVTIILLLIVTCLFLLNRTGLNTRYVIGIINKGNYYQVLYDNIKDEMLYYVPQSGFTNDIIDDTYTYDEVKRDLNSVIKNTYRGKTTEIDTTKFEERLNTKINNYIEEKNFKITNKEELQDFTNEMAKIYVSKIKLSGYTDMASKYLNKLIKILDILLIIFIIILLVSLIINLIFFKFKKIGVILFTNTFLLIIINIIIKRKIPIKNIFIYNNLVSSIVKDIINKFLSYMFILTIIYFVLGVIVILLMDKKEKVTK